MGNEITVKFGYATANEFKSEPTPPANVNEGVITATSPFLHESVSLSYILPSSVPTEERQKEMVTVEGYELHNIEYKDDKGKSGFVQAYVKVEEWKDYQDFLTRSENKRLEIEKQHVEAVSDALISQFKGMTASLSAFGAGVSRFFAPSPDHVAFSSLPKREIDEFTEPVRLPSTVSTRDSAVKLVSNFIVKTSDPSKMN
jgi:hypothetical protein